MKHRLGDYLKPENLSEELNNLCNDVRGGIPTAAFGVRFPEKCYIVSALGMPVIYIARDELTAKNAAKTISAFSDEKVVYLPAKDDVLLFNRAVGKENYYARITALYELSHGAKTVCATFESLLQLMPKKINFLKLEKGGEYPFESLIKNLISMGYNRVEEVDRKGEFTLRGDILHVFPINGETPFRIDFFGDEIEKITLYDGIFGRFEEETDDILILSAVDFTIEDDEIPKIKEALKSEIRVAGIRIYTDKVREIVGEITQKLDGDKAHSMLSFISPLLRSMSGNIRDYIGEDAVVVYDECKLLNDGLMGIIKEHYDRCSSLKRSGECFTWTVNQLKSQETLIKELDFNRKLAISGINSAINFFSPLKTYKLNFTSLPRYHLKPEEFFTDIKNWKQNGYKVLCCCGSTERADKIFNMLEDKKIFSDLSNDFPENFQGVKITSYYIPNGFIYHAAKLALIGSDDLFAKRESEKKIKRRRNDIYNAPEIGDYCVHETHGIGIVRGTKKITTTEGTKDYVAIEYKGGDMLYVCVDRMDSLSKYLGGENPPLSRLGGEEFERVKERVKASIARLTIDLKRLYKERSDAKGYRFSPDNAFVSEFEENFKFEETEDQLQSVKEIKKDMESDKVMDRLICGDVGYGKTEVALRAAFKAMADGKQVALIAPTTILSEQHYMTCLDRFKDFGIRIGVLNRFRTPSNQQKTLTALKNGEIDMIIGTHRLFSKDVAFKDLGLLIIDEEQRFGVEHKEKIKLMKKNVDTLTLSATPIPRTLHMSLTGIRDISVINTPPSNRIPVQVFVTEESDALIRDAVIKEFSRDGQTYILYNKVESINAFAEHIRGLIPEVRIVVGHGQMKERELEENIMAFYKKEFDVLISTTIIENGVDLPSANTMIVIDADKMGLSTLYQLKGRVGRSDKMARAYFTYKEDKILSEPAYKRLSALAEYSDFGSGFKIAMRDLEIRGAGNVMGKEQHGHMDKIGYELYSKLLKEQLTEKKTEKVQTELDIGVSAFIPESYINSSAVRMDCYKQIAEIAGDDDEKRVIDSMSENYGKLPAEVINLIKIARLKEYCFHFNILKAQIRAQNIMLKFTDINAINDEGLMAALKDSKGKAKLCFEEKSPCIAFENDGVTPEIGLEKVTRFLLFAYNNDKSTENLKKNTAKS